MKMLETGLNVGLGTDGPASNNDLDMFEEMRLAAFLAKGTTGDPTALPARLALAMATRLGARALHLGDITGSIEAGKRADFVLVDITPLHNQPSFSRDPNALYSRLVYAAKSTDVTDVWCNGKRLLESGRLTTLNEADLVKEAGDWAKRIDHFLIAREESLLQKLIAIGGAVEGESFEVQVKARPTSSPATRSPCSAPSAITSTTPISSSPTNRRGASAIARTSSSTTRESSPAAGRG
jgi:5-methylthioadenosine/S-adenosylhomocysteine deaminase